LREAKKIIFIVLVTVLLLGCSKKSSEKFNYGTIEYNGKIWMDRNLGAKEACKSLEGNNACWGNIYQWGRPSDGHEQRRSKITELRDRSCNTYLDSSFVIMVMNINSDKNLKEIYQANWYSKCDEPQSSLWSSQGDGINEVCPIRWHVATKDDFESAKIKDAKDAFKKLKLTLGGIRQGIEVKHYTGEILAAGLMGRYWTATIAQNGSIVSYDIDQVSFVENKMRSINGASVRCVKN